MQRLSCLRVRTFALLAALVWCAAVGAQAQSVDTPDAGAALSRCVDAFRSTVPCLGVLGWCDPVWGIERRERCETRRLDVADAVLKTQWTALRELLAAHDQRNGLEDTPPLRDALLTEQRAWLAFRDATCSWLVRHVDSRDVTGDAERRLNCITDMTLERIDRFKLLEYEALTNR